MIRVLSAAGLVTLAVGVGYLAGCWVRETRKAKADADRWAYTTT